MLLVIQLLVFKASAFLATTGILLCSIPGTPSLAKPQIMQETITVGDVKAAQDGWCNAVTALSKTYAESGFEASKLLASEVVDSAYGYQFGPVSFKPTWAYGETTFRPTKEGAVSYFVGGNPKYRDPGFTIASPGDGNYPNLQNRSQWVKCTPEIVCINLPYRFDKPCLYTSLNIPSFVFPYLAIGISDSLTLEGGILKGHKISPSNFLDE